MPNLSRRHLVTAAAALPALALAAAVPAAAIPLPSPIVAQAPPKQLGTTAISKLDVKRRALRREANAVLRKIKKLNAEFERRMPKPHPSITYSKENDADGLRFYLPDREPHSLHSYISSRDIEIGLEKIERPGAAIERINGEVLIYPHRSQPMSDEDATRRERHLARLELSREYERQMEKLDRQLGLGRLNKELENRIWPRLSNLENRIYAAPAVTRADLDVKLALYDSDTRDDWLVERLLRDLHRLAALVPLPADAVLS